MNLDLTVFSQKYQKFSLFKISYVVTAAHCFSENNPDNFAVAPESLTLAFGLDNISVLEDPILPTILKIQKRTIKKIYPYDTYSFPAAKNDIAVVELSKPVELSKIL